jgi:hypothetical protein
MREQANTGLAYPSPLETLRWAVEACGPSLVMTFAF